MIKIRIIRTGEIKTVTPNEAHGLIDSGKAEVVRGEYKTVVMNAQKSKYKTK